MNHQTVVAQPGSTGTPRKLLRIVGWGLVWLVLAVMMLWSVAALFIDVRVPVLRIPLAVFYVLVVAAMIVMVKRTALKAALCFVSFCIVLTWWLSLTPTNQADWQPDADRTASIEINGDEVRIHNLRNCNYRTETDYSDCWTDRTFHLSDIRYADLFFTTWGPKYIGHPIFSFQFGDHDHVAFSIEARYKLGQSYSAILGFFRQYELIFVAADESDVIRLRTNYRHDEQVFLYRTTIPADSVRKIFLLYVNYVNYLRDHPEWYNALTRNCTTAVDKQIALQVENPQPWNYQLLLNGTLDRLLYERGRLVSDGLPFPEFKEREHINAVAHTVTDPADYSRVIREGRVGF